MNVFSNRIWIFVSLLLGISFILHFWRIDIPNTPAFDEIHFATYAADYVKKITFFDIHPPLGKFIYATPLFFVDANALIDSEYAKQEKKSDDLSIITTTSFFKPFNHFPYQALRTIGALFGLLLVYSIFFFLKSLTRNNITALLGMCFIVFESALLMETRLILLNGMFLAFGFLALGFLYKEKPNLTLTGIFWGLALSIKLISIVFLGPILFFFFSRRLLFPKTSFVRLCIISFSILFFLWVVISAIFLPVESRLAFYASFFEIPHFIIKINHIVDISFPTLFASQIKAFFIESYVAIRGYTVGKFHPAQSPWYLWPYMIMPFNYSPITKVNMVLLGNPFVWMLGTLSVVFSLCVLALTRLRGWITQNNAKSVLLVGYFSSLLPYALLHRSTFLYHYFPALIFSICLASVYIQEHLETLSEKRKKRVLALIIGGTLLGFAFAAPFIYAF
ncbi:MAG: phospholipid carrier-dependent glycosyltransferase [Candidatus Paceibacterota bacterium]|jgi:dolichyl-phosphate-mannose--protein O-mannosyl transferase